MSTATEAQNSAPRSPATISKIAVGIDGFPQGRDAAVLGSALARAADAELLLVAVHPQPIVVLPTGMDWASQEKEAAAVLTEIRDQLAPGARTVVETDLSVARALHRVIEREHRDLLVVGSSRHAADGRVRIGKRTRQLLCNFECALAVAPEGLRDRGMEPPRRIGVGYDGGPESDAAVQLASSLAAGSGAELGVVGIVDDRLPSTGWSYVWADDMVKDWEETLEHRSKSLLEHAEATAKASGAVARVETVRGRPADRLLELSGEVDLLVMGSRRWGPMARLMLGSTGEALMHDAACPVLVVPRPAE